LQAREKIDCVVKRVAHEDFKLGVCFDKVGWVVAVPAISVQLEKLGGGAAL
jgi:hypothetical protein